MCMISNQIEKNLTISLQICQPRFTQEILRLTPCFVSLNIIVSIIASKVLEYLSLQQCKSFIARLLTFTFYSAKTKQK